MYGSDYDSSSTGTTVTTITTEIPVVHAAYFPALHRAGRSDPASGPDWKNRPFATERAVSFLFLPVSFLFHIFKAEILQFTQNCINLVMQNFNLKFNGYDYHI